MSLILSGTDGLSDVDGSAATPAIRGTDANTGIFFPAADTIAFSEGGAEVARFDSSGNLGIGTASATTAGGKLTVQATGTYTVSAWNATAVAANVGATYFMHGGVDANNLGFIGAYFTGSTTTAGGYLTLGTRDVAGSTSEKMRIDSSGKVGIGTSSPAVNLNVYGASNPQIAVSSPAATGAFFVLAAGGTTINSTSFDLIHDSSGNASVWNRSNAYLNFATNNTERMRIDSSGQLLIGLTSQVVGANIQATTTGSNSNIFVRNTTATTGYFLWGNANSADKLLCAQTGSITNATGTYGTISDAKLKENIVDATPKLNKVTQLQVRNFNFIGDDLNQIGFIAQEIEQIFPSLVEEHISRDEKGNETGEVTKSVKTSILIPILVKAIQEQQALITALTARITALETP